MAYGYRRVLSISDYTQMGENNQVNAHGAASVRAVRPMRIGVDFL